MNREELNILFDYYGTLLSGQQRDCFDLYHNEDLSLSEIAELKNSSRQSVWDAIRHAEAKLIEFEEATGLVHRVQELETQIRELRDDTFAKTVVQNQQNRENSGSRKNSDKK